MAFWWCLDHKQVEGEDGCRAEVRLGPYPDRPAAEHALSSVRERERRLDQQDEDWEQGGQRS